MWFYFLIDLVIVWLNILFFLFDFLYFTFVIVKLILIFYLRGYMHLWDLFNILLWFSFNNHLIKLFFELLKLFFLFRLNILFIILQIYFRLCFWIGFLLNFFQVFIAFFLHFYNLFLILLFNERFWQLNLRLDDKLSCISSYFHWFNIDIIKRDRLTCLFLYIDFVPYLISTFNVYLMLIY